MGIHDFIAVEHECPKCRGRLPNYQASLTCSHGTYRFGEPINLGEGSNFEFELIDVCSRCKISIEGVGIVKDYIFVEVRELGYRKIGSFSEGVSEGAFVNNKRIIKKLFE